MNESCGCIYCRVPKRNPNPSSVRPGQTRPAHSRWKASELDILIGLGRCCTMEPTVPQVTDLAVVSGTGPADRFPLGLMDIHSYAPGSRIRCEFVSVPNCGVDGPDVRSPADNVARRWNSLRQNEDNVAVSEWVLGSPAGVRPHAWAWPWSFGGVRPRTVQLDLKLYGAVGSGKCLKLCGLRVMTATGSCEFGCKLCLEKTYVRGFTRWFRSTVAKCRTVQNTECFAGLRLRRTVH